jgi:hypothetical protein
MDVRALLVCSHCGQQATDAWLSKKRNRPLVGQGRGGKQRQQRNNRVRGLHMSVLDICVLLKKAMHYYELIRLNILCASAGMLIGEYIGGILEAWGKRRS